ncbi:MAG: hypothetical protein Q9190_000520 [Brigantiaea leucoxantha]
MGGHRSSAVQGIGNSITVMIIDSCPSTNAWNYCKTDVDLEEKCMSRARNSLDIERQAYQDLTGQPPGSGPNLEIGIEPVMCSGESQPSTFPANDESPSMASGQQAYTSSAQPVPTATSPGITQIVAPPSDQTSRMKKVRKA